MITAFIGSPGCGKSTALAWVARRATRKPGKPIYICGSPVSTGHSHLFTNFFFPGAYVLDYEKLGKYKFEDALILIDEMNMYSDNRDYKNFSNCLKWFYSQHRKMHLDIIWASQSADSDKKIRERTVGFYMISPTIIPGVTQFRLLEPFTDVVNYNIVSGYDWGRRQFFFTRPLYKLFDSYQTFGIDGDSLPPVPLQLWDNYGQEDTFENADFNPSDIITPSPDDL